MRTLSTKYLGGLELPEDQYKVDLAVLDRYQSFSSELLRLSLLGITGYGFLITKYPQKVSAFTKFTLVTGVLALGVSAATALGHRYFSTDCIAHYVRRLRLEKMMVEQSTSASEVENRKQVIQVEQASLEKDLSRCAGLLLASSIALVIGAGCVALGFASVLW